MKIETILENKQALYEAKVKQHWQLCESVTHDMTPEQRRVVENIVLATLEIHKHVPLLEAELTANQINQLFGNVEKAATDAGGNRTMLGKGKDAAAAVNNALNQVGKYLQNTTPVKNFDAAFEKAKANLKAKLGGDDSKVVQLTQKLGQYAKDNPGKTAAIIGLMTAAAGIAGGPVGGAIAGKLLRGGMELVKGEKISTAVGKGMKQAAAGAAIGAASDAIGDMFGSDAADAVQGTADAQKVASVAQSKDAVDAVSDVDPSDAADAGDAAASKVNNFGDTEGPEVTGGGKPAGFADMSPEEQVDTLVFDMNPEDWSNADYEAVKAAGRLDPEAVRDYYAANLKDFKDATDNNIHNISDFIERETGQRPSQDVVDWLETYAQKEGDWSYDSDTVWANKGVADSGDAGLEKAMDAGTAAQDDPDFAKGAAADNKADFDKGTSAQDNVKAGDSKVKISNQQSNTDTVKTDGGSTTTSTSSGTIQGLSTREMRAHPEWEKFYNPRSDNPKSIEIARRVADMKFKQALVSGKITMDSYIPTGKKLSEGQIYLLFNRLATVNQQWLDEGIIFESVFDAVRAQQLDEGPMDAIKKGIGAVGGAIGGAAAKVGQKLATAGKNLTTKVTADKLKSAWTKAGSPTDSNAVADILAQAGVNSEVVKTVYKDMGIEAPASAAPAQEEPAEEPTAQDAQKPAQDNSQDTANAQDNAQAGGIDIATLAKLIRQAGVENEVKAMLQGS